jgi:hypothetical protein
MTDIIIWIYAFCIAIFLSSVVLIPLLGLCYTFLKLKMQEISDKVGH